LATHDDGVRIVDLLYALLGGAARFVAADWASAPDDASIAVTKRTLAASHVRLAATRLRGKVIASTSNFIFLCRSKRLGAIIGTVLKFVG
jgi:hypothetical protein